MALFVALGGTAYAANTVGSADIIDGEVKSVDIGNNEIGSADVKDNSINTFDVHSFLGVDVVGRHPDRRRRVGVNTHRRETYIGSQQVASDEVEVSPDKKVAIVALAIDGKGTDEASNRSIEVLREQVVPATVGQLDRVEVAVSGGTAWSKDFLDTMKSHLPIVFGFVLSLSFILLLVTFRSIVIPIKAIVINLLSVGAAYGMLVLVFQDGTARSCSGFTSVGGIAPLASAVPLRDPLRALDGLPRVPPEPDPGGLDRGLTTGVGRPRHQVHRPHHHRRRGRHGRHLRDFATGDDQSMQQLGFGLAVAILSTPRWSARCWCRRRMKLLGNRNWYLPKGLGWLPKFEHEPEVAPAGA